MSLDELEQQQPYANTYIGFLGTRRGKVNRQTHTISGTKIVQGLKIWLMWLSCVNSQGEWC